MTLKSKIHFKYPTLQDPLTFVNKMLRVLLASPLLLTKAPPPHLCLPAASFASFSIFCSVILNFSPYFLLHPNQADFVFSVGSRFTLTQRTPVLIRLAAGDHTWSTMEGVCTRVVLEPRLQRGLTVTKIASEGVFWA